MSEFASPASQVLLRPDLLAIAGRIRPGEKVLDLGCGDGTLLRYLMDTLQVTGRGIELSEAGVLACVQRGVSVRQGNLHEGLGDYPDGSFDTVILSQTIQYLNDPAFILCEMLRVGRRAIISFSNWGYWRSRLAWLLTGRVPTGGDLPPTWDASPRARPMTVSDFEALCQREAIRVSYQAYLNGPRSVPAGLSKYWRATVAIFELVLD